MNGMQVKNQIIEFETSESRRKQAELELEMRQSMEAEFKFKAEQEAEAERRRLTISQYKKALDSQMTIKKKAQMYGNMTGMEKQINKDEMLAYRNHDTQPYTMIPGLNSSPPKMTKKLE